MDPRIRRAPLIVRLAQESNRNACGWESHTECASAGAMHGQSWDASPDDEHSGLDEDPEFVAAHG
jgi:hypothetical protein